MKRIIVLVVLLIAGIACAEEVEIQPTKVFLIRHAPAMSDGTKDPDLAPEGKTMAARWASVFASEELSMIYSTDYKRTQQTAHVIATNQGNMKITSYDPHDLDLEKLMSEIAGQTVLIVGHSNTTPMVANGLLGAEKYAQFDHEEYGTLIVIQYLADAPASAAILHID